ncbi:MAG TPA: Rieske (2Fe-2S) protein [Thermoanaerobaculia bacterium]|nr:Rieske (2Fe-2S) protein [Thermoanaerobaculia bacterium]
MQATDTRLDRRRLINWFLGTSFGALIISVVYPILRYVTPPRIAEASMNEVDAGAVDDPLLIEKGFKIVRFGAEPVILVRTADARFYAYSATCTHLDCIVGFQKEQNRIWCNCHGGGYDLTGRNVSGPPPRPLTAYKVNVVPRSGGQQTIVVSKA